MPNPERRQLALDMFIYQVQKQIGAAAAAMGGIDVLVFTAGVGENTGYVREEVCKNLKFLGVEIDSELNKARGVELDISAKGASVKTVIIPTNEELTIARDTKEIVEKI